MNTTPAESRLLTRNNAPLVIGTVAIVTLVAFENRAVTTSLPTTMQELGGLSAYGLALATPVSAFLIALTISGWSADRHGPGRVLRIGAVLFILGQLLSAVAPTVPIFVVGRLFSGLSEGFLDVGLMVLIALILDSALRPKMMALLSAAWILPSVLGPVVAGAITDLAHWRWIYGIGLALIALTWPMLRPAIRRSRHRPPVPDDSAPDLLRFLPWAALAAGALVVLNIATESLSSAHDLGIVTIACGLVALAALPLTAARLLPRGTLRATHGIGGVIAVRALVAAAFGGIGAFLPLLLTTQRDFSATTAGSSLMITGLFWSVGSAIQARLSDRPVALVRVGLILVASGALGTLLLLSEDLSPALGLISWALAAVGMGLSSSTLSVLTMSASSEHDYGRNNAASQMASSMSVAAYLAIAGAALATRGAEVESFALLAVLAALSAGSGLALTPRLPAK